MQRERSKDVACTCGKFLLLNFYFVIKRQQTVRIVQVASTADCSKRCSGMPVWQLPFGALREQLADDYSICSLPKRTPLPLLLHSNSIQKTPVRDENFPTVQPTVHLYNVLFQMEIRSFIHTYYNHFMWNTVYYY